MELIRVVNEQVVPPGLSNDGTVIVDKIGPSPGFSTYARQRMYVPFANPNNPVLKGYIDLVPTDEVLMAVERGGSIYGLSRTDPPTLSFFSFASEDAATPVVSSVEHGVVSEETTVTGTVFVSLTPDITYVQFENGSGIVQRVPRSSFSSISDTEVVVPDSAVSIGTPDSTWSVKVFANSKLSNSLSITDV